MFMLLQVITLSCVIPDDVFSWISLAMSVIYNILSHNILNHVSNIEIYGHMFY